MLHLRRRTDRPVVREVDAEQVELWDIVLPYEAIVAGRHAHNVDGAVVDVIVQDALARQELEKTAVAHVQALGQDDIHPIVDRETCRRRGGRAAALP